MCIAFIKKTSDKLILAHNRDEYFSRTATSLSFHKDKNLFCGIDLDKGGTWFALSPKGSFSFVTNLRFRHLVKENMTSRGEIPFKLLGKEKINHSLYNPFQAVVGDFNQLVHINGLNGEKTQIKDPLFGVSNGPLPSEWPKLVNGQKEFDQLDLALSDENLKDQILEVMQNKTQYDYVPEGTGFSPEQEKLLSSIYIANPNYGTVSTTVVIISKTGVYLHEEGYANNSRVTQQITL